MSSGFGIRRSGGAACLLLMMSVSNPRLAGQAGAQPLPIIELRQYTLHPGKRDVLIELFEREFIEGQEAVGMKILGTFRDLDNPDHFVWIRGFTDMPSRAEGLNAFYSGPVWKSHSAAANATMIDSNNVLLLHTARVGSGFAPATRPRPPKGASTIPGGLVIANIYSFDAAVSPDFVEFFERDVTPVLKAAGITVRASYVSESSVNNFPRLPVRDQDHVFIWFSAHANRENYDDALAKLRQSAAWPAISATLQRRLQGAPEVLRLQPTARSEMRD